MSVTTIKTKIRALITDALTRSSETFEYETSSAFTLQENNIDEVLIVTVNDVATTNYTYSSTTNAVTIADSLTSGDQIKITYNYYQYSTTELTNYITGSLVYITAYLQGYEQGYELVAGDIEPTPDKRTEDLVALICAIMINPDYNEYRLPTVTVRYNGRLPKEQKIEQLINRFKYGRGVIELIETEDV